MNKNGDVLKQMENHHLKKTKGDHQSKEKRSKYYQQAMWDLQEGRGNTTKV